ncbi:MAG: hypothetical protein WC262_11865 [Bacteroidales bacterium]|jgi:hypothetical protein
MNFIGPSWDNPTPNTPSQKVLGAGFIVATLIVTGIVFWMLLGAVDVPSLSLSIVDLISLPVVATVIVLCGFGFLIAVIHW